MVNGDDFERSYLEARVEGAKTLAEVYNLYSQAPECFVAGVQYALDKMLARTTASAEATGMSAVLHTNAVDILTQAKEKRL